MQEWAPQLDLTIRAGLEFVYETQAVTPMLLLIKPRFDSWQQVREEQLIFDPPLSSVEYEDYHGNLVHRLSLPPGRTRIFHDCFVGVPSLREDAGVVDDLASVDRLSPDLLRYTLPSRYCDSDRLLNFSFQLFGQLPNSLARIQAICNWVHRNIEYRFGSGLPTTSATDIITQGFGVCRDFAHVAIALCRTFNIPTRYVTGYVPDVAYQDPGTPMDFHAYFQAFIGGRWQTFDARFNEPRVGRIKIACGQDAVDGAFSTVYGAANLLSFRVWAYQVNPRHVHIGAPIDLSQRLDGTPYLQIPN
jgi:transglutaminase-like putative cysteine protease